MPATATLSSNNTAYLVVETNGARITRKRYPLGIATCWLIEDETGFKTYQLRHLEQSTIAVSDNPDSPYFGNSIFGSTSPTTAQTTANAAIGASGGGGGSTTATLDPLQKLILDRESGNTITAVRRDGASIPTIADFLIGNKKICRLHFVNYSNTQLFIQFHNSPSALISGVNTPASSEIYPIVGTSTSNPGILALFSADFSNSGNWGTSTRVAISTTRTVYTAPSVGILAQTSINIESIAIV
jgi:hypothetical protein